MRAGLCFSNPGNIAICRQQMALIAILRPKFFDIFTCHVHARKNLSPGEEKMEKIERLRPFLSETVVAPYRNINNVEYS